MAQTASRPELPAQLTRPLVGVGIAMLLGLALIDAGAQPCAMLMRFRLAHPGLHADIAIVVLIAASVLTAALSRLEIARLRAPHFRPISPYGAADQLDPLTGLPNRLAFQNTIAPGLASGQPAGLVVMNIDAFRSIRSLHGSNVSDALLREFACRLAGLAPRTAHLSRLHGDEFAVLVPGLDGAALANEAALMLAGLSAPFVLDGQSLSVPVSIGAAVLPEDGTSFDCAMRAALLAMQKAKADGGGTVRLFEPALGREAQIRTKLTAEFRAALAAGDVVPYYQPIVDLADGRTVGFEVLARWQHPVQGLLLPDQFIPMAEEQHLCGQLSLCLLKHVIKDAADWPRHWTFAFNATASQLPELIAFVNDPTQIPGDMLAPRRLALELTESTLIRDLGVALDVVRSMRANGTRVVLDDFGTGYANFLQLRELPFDGIKIDRSFVQNLLDDPRTEACIRAMHALAQSLNVSITAEGIETWDMLQRLRDMGCTYGQGYLFSPPVPAAHVPAFATAAFLSRQAA
jgi:diguanylate cyclase (GGDEF)-like protein